MTNDELKALCESNARAIEATNTSLNRTIDQLVVDFIRPLTQQSVATQQIVNSNARAIEANASAISDLKRSLELSVKLTDDMASEAADNENRIDANESRFDTLLAEIKADRQRSQDDAAKWQANFDAQQEVLQRLLLEIRSTNGEVKKLSDRITGLEAG